MINFLLDIFGLLISTRGGFPYAWKRSRFSLSIVFENNLLLITFLFKGWWQFFNYY